MVRILEVKSFKEKRKILVERSQEYREELESDFAEVKASAVAVKRYFSFAQIAGRLLKVAAPVAGAFFGRKKEQSNGSGGFVSRFLSGLNYAASVASIFRKAKAAPEPEDSDHH